MESKSRLLFEKALFKTKKPQLGASAFSSFASATRGLSAEAVAAKGRVRKLLRGFGHFSCQPPVNYQARNADFKNFVVRFYDLVYSAQRLTSGKPSLLSIISVSQKVQVFQHILILLHNLAATLGSIVFFKNLEGC
ncbi:hypothetical protein L596_002016 [Steinernema carpocapsae]|uniref:Uncharacterized protein n=1 Tax=Steinernema carpocapsae TaxID=34508 RepID=A0A4U8UNZ7_STECR|nr:hypothetical protein L596_002016 [Steinernema carpocapsae]